MVAFIINSLVLVVAASKVNRWHGGGGLAKNMLYWRSFCCNLSVGYTPTNYNCRDVTRWGCFKYRGRPTAIFGQDTAVSPFIQDQAPVLSSTLKSNEQQRRPTQHRATKIFETSTSLSNRTGNALPFCVSRFTPFVWLRQRVACTPSPTFEASTCACLLALIFCQTPEAGRLQELCTLGCVAGKQKR